MASASWQRLCNAGLGILLATLLALAPLWRHRVLVHRPPFEVYFAHHDIIAYTSDYVMLVFLVVGWAAQLLNGARDGQFSFGPWFVSGPLGLLVIWIALSAIWAVDPLYAGYQGVRYLLWGGLYLLLANLAIPTIWITVGVASSVAFQSVIGLGQVLLRRSLGLRRLGELVLNPLWSGVSVVITEEGRHLRAHGLTQHPNLLGGTLVILLLLLVGLLLHRHGQLSRPSTLLLTLAFGLGSATLLFTFSRGAWLAALVGGSILLLLLVRSSGFRFAEVLRRLRPVIAVGFLISLAFTISQWALLRPRLGLIYQGAEVRSVDERATLLKGARALRRLRPWLGVGAGNFPTALYELAPATIRDYPIFQPVHRVPVLIAAELGPIASAVWMILMLAPLASLLFFRPDVTVGGWLAALTAVPVALYVVGWVEAYPWSSHQGTLLTWIVLGMWARAYRDAAYSAEE